MSDPYVALADEVKNHPEVMNRLTEWFDSDHARSAYPFGNALGHVDIENALALAVSSWLEAGRCEELVSGYLRGIAGRLGTLPEEWQRRLDQQAVVFPSYTASVTLRADKSHAGYRRIMQLIHSKALALSYVRGFTYEGWPDKILSTQEKSEIIETLLSRKHEEASPPVSLAVHLLALWTDYGKRPLPSPLDELAQRVLRDSMLVQVNPGDWLAIIQTMAERNPISTADLLLTALIAQWPSRLVGEDGVLALLKTLAASNPNVVLDAIDHVIQEPERRAFFDMRSFPGLFEALGFDSVRSWIEKHGSEYARYVARHLKGPFLHEGTPIVPPLTEWLLARFEDDDEVFRRFCLGRWPRIAWRGDARDRLAEREKALAPFRQHSLRRIREWVEYELGHARKEAEWDKLSDEYRERVN
jgi:hypothetical protein